MIKMEKKHIKPAVSLLTRTFKDEFTEAFPDPEVRKVKEPFAHEFFLKRDLSDNEVYVTSDKLEGIAGWGHSNKWNRRKPWRIFTSGAIWPAMRIGIRALNKIQKFDKYMDKKHRELVPREHWYLGVLAVDPAYQGRGYGSKLLRGMLSRIDEDGLPCYVETEGEKNVSMYEHFGFKVLEEYTIPGTKDKLVAMLREPNVLKKVN